VIRPGLYCTPNGFEVIAEDSDGRLVRIHLPLTLDGMEAAGQKIIQATQTIRRTQAAPAGERPKLTALGGAQCN